MIFIIENISVAHIIFSVSCMLIHSTLTTTLGDRDCFCLPFNHVETEVLKDYIELPKVEPLLGSRVGICTQAARFQVLCY